MKIPCCCRGRTSGPPWCRRISSRWCWWWEGCWCCQRTGPPLILLQKPFSEENVWTWSGSLKLYLQYEIIWNMIITCKPERNHHNKAEDNVDSETPGHLNVGLSLPLFVFIHWEPSLVPVFKWRGKIEAKSKVQELVEKIFLRWKPSWKGILDKKCWEKSSSW